MDGTRYSTHWDDGIRGTDTDEREREIGLYSNYC
jgi:hypothetical protein